MRTVLGKVVLGAVALVLTGAGGGAAFLALKSPAQRPALAVRAEATPARLERGKYLVENVSSCLQCHSPSDKTRWAAPLTGGARGAGGECWTPETGFPGTLCAGNLTPHADGLGQWSDGEVLRAMREGVDRHGAPLFDIMPYGTYRNMSDEDALAVVAYLRSLPAVAGKAPARTLDFPLSVVVKFQPQPLEGAVAEPDRTSSVAYGRYLVDIAGCETCHTPVDAQHRPLPGQAFAGGKRFPLDAKGAEVVSSNITPHPTGLGGWSREGFVAHFKSFQGAHDLPAQPTRNTVMPWLVLAGMTEQDLGAIYDYLRTVPPVENTVVKFPQAAVAATQ